MIARHLWLLLLMLYTPSIQGDRDPFFPKGAFYRRDIEADEFTSECIGAHLANLEEHSIWRRARSDDKIEVYRMFWWPSRGQPTSVRITKRDGVIILSVARIRRVGLKETAKPPLRRELKLTDQQWKDCVDLLEKTPFWRAPTKVVESWGIADGDRIFIEGVKAGNYHVIDRAGLTTSECYKRFCRKLLWLSKSHDVVLWDLYRQSERRRRRYQWNYSETQDSGVYNRIWVTKSPN